MRKNKAGKRSRNSRKRKGSRGGGVQLNPNLSQAAELRTCPCSLHETFWVTESSKQIYAFRACSKRVFDMRKKQALMQLIFKGLVRLGTSIERALQIAQRAILRFYTRYVKLIESLGWKYNAKSCQWVIKTELDHGT